MIDVRSAVVHVVDDDDSLRAALARRLRIEGYAVRAYASAQEFIENYRDDGCAGCILLDVQMPGMDGLDLQAELQKREIELPIVFLTSHGNVPMSVRAMKAGADNFLLKPARDEALMAAVEGAVGRNQSHRASGSQVLRIRKAFASLTAREREVMGFVVAGEPNKRIATELGVAEITVKVHRANVMRKMEAGSLPDLVRAASLLGLTDA